MKHLYTKFQEYYNNKLVLYNQKVKREVERGSAVKLVICSRFEIYLLPSWKDEVLEDIEYYCIGSILLIVYLDNLLQQLIGKHKEDISSIILNAEGDYITEVEEALKTDISKLKRKLILWLKDSTV